MNILYPKIYQGINFSKQTGTSDSYKASYWQLVALAYKSILTKCVDLCVHLSEMCCTHCIDVLAELL